VVVLHGLGAYSASTRAPRPRARYTSLLFGPPTYHLARPPAQLPAQSLISQPAFLLARPQASSLDQQLVSNQSVPLASSLDQLPQLVPFAHWPARSTSCQPQAQPPASLPARSFTSLPACLSLAHRPASRLTHPSTQAGQLACLPSASCQHFPQQCAPARSSTDRPALDRAVAFCSLARSHSVLALAPTLPGLSRCCALLDSQHSSGSRCRYSHAESARQHDNLRASSFTLTDRPRRPVAGS
jgi:hypothetical protein